MTKHCKTCRKDKDTSEFVEDNKPYKTCNECRPKKRRSNERLTIGQCKEFAISKGGECLSEEYINTKTKMNWRCSEGHEWSQSFSVLKNQGSWCPKCANLHSQNYKRLTIQDCKEFAISKGGECLSEEYKSNKTKTNWRCSEGHEWSQSFSVLKNHGCWCPTCANNERLTIEQCKEFALSKNGECLSEEYKNAKTKMQWRCAEGHEWEAHFNNIKSGSWCPKCANLHSQDYKRLTIKECKEYAINKGGECLSEEYKNARTKMNWRCSENHEWEAIFDSVKRGRWCPICGKNNKSENLCREILEDMFCEKFPTQRPKFLEGLELDGYNEELNIAFEYNGIQHYEYCPEFFHKKGLWQFEKQKEHDRKKYRICSERGINLIIIPHQYDHTTPDELKDFIYREILKFSH